jgi:MFS family permease
MAASGVWLGAVSAAVGGRGRQRRGRRIGLRETVDAAELGQRNARRYCVVMPPARPPDRTAATRARIDPALVVIAGGVAAALHVGKLPPAIAALQAALGITLVEAGFLLSLVQLAGVGAGVAFGVLVDGLGGRRSMLAGLVLLALASAAGGAADGVAALLVLRALEGCGFLLVALAAPGLVRRLTAPARLPLLLGVWGAYMPLATALALLAGPWVIAGAGWRVWWWGLALVALAMALWLALAVHEPPAAAAPNGGARATGWAERLRRTLAAPGPWLVACCFAAYSGQWLAVIGFLPVIYLQAGVPAALTGALTALAAAVNMLGNIGAGRALHRGVPAARLLAAGFVAMALAAFVAYASAGWLPPAARYGAVLLFSGLGGMIPATLFALAVRVAPGDDAIGSTIGFVQQWSAFGQFAGPPLVAWVASRAGGWQWTWLVTGASSLLGLILVRALAQRAAPTR